MRRLVVLLGAGLAAAALQAAPERPKAFPKVPLLPDSAPRLSAVMVDVQTNQIAYVMFDGNVKTGYERLYFWIPGESKYDPPASYRVQEQNKFQPIKFSERTRDGEVSIAWTFGWGRRGGKYTHFNYLTGQTVTGESEVYPVFTFLCDYVSEPRSGSTKPSESKVDLGIYGEMNAAAWTNLPAPYQPWNQLNYYMAMKPFPEKEQGRVHFIGRLNYGNWQTQVRAVPSGTRIGLVVSEYMGKPVYSNSLTSAEAFTTGIEAILPYGWYDLAWDMDVPGLKIRPRLDVHVRLNPYPVTPYLINP